MAGGDAALEDVRLLIRVEISAREHFLLDRLQDGLSSGSGALFKKYYFFNQRAMTIKGCSSLAETSGVEGSRQFKSDDWLLDNAVWYELFSSKNSLLRKEKHEIGVHSRVDQGT
jgi:hypothetical protein